MVCPTMSSRSAATGSPLCLESGDAWTIFVSSLSLELDSCSKVSHACSSSLSLRFAYWLSFRISSSLSDAASALLAAASTLLTNKLLHFWCSTRCKSAAAGAIGSAAAHSTLPRPSFNEQVRSAARNTALAPATRGGIFILSTTSLVWPYCRAPRLTKGDSDSAAGVSNFQPPITSVILAPDWADTLSLTSAAIVTNKLLMAFTKAVPTKPASGMNA
mmetsp:Transcript_61297/g.145951  ORF Transcript_61297/g.145951 Transcript_61297/m.145951 type:complete len:217 (+) Transcript_61297:478-1128(+)